MSWLSDSPVATVNGRSASAPPPAPGAWGLGNALLVLLITLAFYTVGSIGVGLAITGFARSFYNHHRLAVEIGAYQFLALGVLVAIVLVLAPRTSNTPAALGFRLPSLPVLLLSAASIVLLYFGEELVQLLFSTLWPSFHIESNTKDLLQGSKSLPLAEQALLMVWASVEAPLVEETLFRGVLFQGFTRFASRWLRPGLAVFCGALTSGFLFGLAHFEPHTLPILVFLGFGLAYIYYFSRSLYCSMVVHGINNFIAVMVFLHSL